MAVAVIIDIPGGNEQIYEQLTAKLFPEGKLERQARARLGNREYPPLGPAPGTYVHE